MAARFPRSEGPGKPSGQIYQIINHNPSHSLHFYLKQSLVCVKIYQFVLPTVLCFFPAGNHVSFITEELSALMYTRKMWNFKLRHKTQLFQSFMPFPLHFSLSLRFYRTPSIYIKYKKVCQFIWSGEVWGDEILYPNQDTCTYIISPP